MVGSWNGTGGLVMDVIALTGEPQATWSLWMVWAVAVVLLGVGFVMCGNVVALGPSPARGQNLGFRLGRMVMLLGTLTAVVAAVVTVLALVS